MHDSLTAVANDPESQLLAYPKYANLEKNNHAK
jgi:hypothetical protein